MKRSLLVVVAALLATSVATAADPAAQPATGGPARLPQDHPYQQQLRAYLATLQEADFLPEHKDLTVVPTNEDADARFRLWLLSLQPPSVGRKRNFSSVMIRPGQFTLASIEGPASVMRPPAHPEALVDLANWNYPGNPYANSRPLRLRAFVVAALDMIMADRLLDAPEDPDQLNLDRLTGAISRFSYVYPGFREVVPKEVSAAYLVGLKRYVTHLLAHAPQDLRATPPGIYTRVAPALALASTTLNDPAITEQAKAYVKPIFTDEKFFRSAGYFQHGGTYDSFNGMSHYYALFAALAADWPFAKDAVKQSYRLRAFLTLPEPDGVLVGPSHMAALTSADAVREQWDSRMRSWAAALLSDDAASLVKMPDAAELDKGGAAAVGEVNAQLHELSWAKNGLEPYPWKFQAPGMLINYAYHYYPASYFARRQMLEAKPEAALLPALRSGSSLERFGDEFTVAKTSNYIAIVHTGPIANPADLEAGLGFGGGALSAFWTRSTGAVILGRGVGSWNPRYKTMADEWRSWPSHAVTGITAGGKVFTSAHIVQPETTFEQTGSTTKVAAHGKIPSTRLDATLLTGELDYSRQFELTPRGVHITTTVSGDGRDSIAELYEALPVFLREAGAQPKATPTLIEFEVGGKWQSATDTFAEQVAAIRLTRFGKSALIKLDTPRRVKLAPADFTDKYMTRAACHNVLIDLLGTNDKPGVIKEARTVSYWIESLPD